MTIQDYGAIGEIIGAISVVISLVYLAVQIKQNTKQIEENTNAVRASAVHASLSYAFDNRAAVFTDEGTSKIFYNGMHHFESLDEIERDRFRLIITNVFDAFMNMHSQTKMTGFATETWDSQSQLIKRALSLPGGTWYWDNFSHMYPDSFQQEVEQIQRTPD